MTAPSKHYVIDTSSLILWWVERYGPETFPTLPDKLAELIEEGRLVSSRSVKDEIKDDPNAKELTLAKWCKAQTGLYQEDAEAVQKAAIALLTTYQDPKKKSGIDGADPFVNARAAVNGKDWCVVSEERPSNGNAHKNPNIPYVCAGQGIEHIDLYTLIKREGWRFG